MYQRNFGRFSAAFAICVFSAASVLAQAPPEIGPQPQPQTSPPTGYKSVYRLAGTNDHLYTTNPNEVRQVTQSGAYALDGVGFYVMDRQYKDTVPLYRFLTPTGAHLLGTDPVTGAADGVKSEGPIGYVDPKPHAGEVPLLAWFNPNNGDWFYTTKQSGEQAPQMGMQYRGIVCYVKPTA